MAGEKVIEGAPQTVDIGPDVGRARSGGLFRSDVIGRAQEHVGERDRGTHDAVPSFPVPDSVSRSAAGMRSGKASLANRGQPEVENLDLAVGGSHQVLRLDIAMDHAALIGMLQSLRGLHDRLRRPARKAAGPADLTSWPRLTPVDEFHDQEVRVAGLLGVVSRHDVGMQGQPGGRLDLAAKSLDQGGIARGGPCESLSRRPSGPSADARPGRPMPIPPIPSLRTIP